MLENEIIKKCLEILMEINHQDGYILLYMDDILLGMLPNYRFKLNLFENSTEWEEYLYNYLAGILNGINKEAYKEDGEIYIELCIKNHSEKISIGKNNVYEIFLKALSRIMTEKMLREI
jgi:hypothetical protein